MTEGAVLIADLADRLRDLIWPQQSAGPRILMIDDWFPDPVIGAGAPRALQILRALSQTGAQVTHFSTLFAPKPGHALLRSLPGVKLARGGSGIEALATYLRRHRAGFDIILISRPHNLRAFKTMTRHRSSADARLVYDAEAIFAQRDVLRMEVTGTPMPPGEAQQVVEEEIALAGAVDSILVVNEANAELFRAHGHADVHVVRHAVEQRWGDSPHDARSGLLFVGPTYSDASPNSDAVVWFVDHVLPLIRDRSGRNHRLTLVGQSTSDTVAARLPGRVDFIGTQPDLTNVYDRARVFIGSTRFAAGVPLKIYEAAAHGVPAVITPILAEQLGWRHEVEALVADTAETFAAQTLRLYDDSELWERTRQSALARTLQDCDTSTFQSTVSASILAVYRNRR